MMEQAIHLKLNILRPSNVEGKSALSNSLDILTSNYSIKLSILNRRKETRQRNISFHLPIIVPLAPQIRLVQDDVSSVTLMEIYEDHCRNIGINKDDPMIYNIKRLKESYMAERLPGKLDVTNMKVDIMNDIAQTMIPKDIVSQVRF
jgi:transformation/transcription domain-associated protein